jgi:hypothetical protein
MSFMDAPDVAALLGEFDVVNAKPPLWKFALLKRQPKTPDFLRMGVSGEEEIYRYSFKITEIFRGNQKQDQPRVPYAADLSGG